MSNRSARAPKALRVRFLVAGRDEPLERGNERAVREMAVSRAHQRGLEELRGVEGVPRVPRVLRGGAFLIFDLRSTHLEALLTALHMFRAVRHAVSVHCAVRMSRENLWVAHCQVSDNLVG